MAKKLGCTIESVDKIKVVATNGKQMLLSEVC